MRCETCMWFCPKVAEPKEPTIPEEKSGALPCARVYSIGRCRRHAPTMNGYPVVYVNDWCGDHKLNEEMA